MKIEFPQANKVYVQKNRSNVLVESNIWSSMGLDFQSNVGVLRISPRLQLNTTLAANLLPIAFRYFDGAMFSVIGSAIYVSNGSFTSTPFIADGSSGTPAGLQAGSDLETIGGCLCTTNGVNLYKKASNGSGTGAWTMVTSSLTTGTNHKLTFLKKFDRLYLLEDGFKVWSVDSALSSVTTSGDYTLNLTTGNVGGDKYFITCLKATSTDIWIGAMALATDDKANRGTIFQWDGISAQSTNQFLTEAHGVQAIVIKDNIPFAMDTFGRLLQFTGSSFDEVGRLPVQSNKLLVNAGQNVTGAFIDANGLSVTKNGTILALVNGLNEDGTQNENFASGVYEFDLKGGCTHKSPFTYTPIASTTITDYGQNRVSATGALTSISGLLFDALGNVGTILAGATYYTNASTVANGVFIDNFADTIQKKGYYVTTWMESDEIAEGWTRLWASFRRFLSATDNIVFKYRNYEVAPVEATITWVNTNSFTTTTDITAYGPTVPGFNGTMGGEVEILQGTGGASCVHITNIVNNAGTYTVTVDDAVAGVTTGTAIARFQKWIKLNPAVPLDQIKPWAQYGIDTDSTPRIQVKACFTFTGEGEFYKSVLVSNSDIKVKL